MATPKQFTMSLKEVAEVLIRHVGATTGNWGVYVKFGLGATNLANQTGELHPAALVPVLELGVQEFPEPNSLTVDAAEVKRRRQPKRSKSSRRPAKTSPGQ
jgi:hypothetical protein